MGDGKAPKATYQDVRDAPEHMTAELVSGELWLQPRPAKPHVRTVSALGAALAARFDLGLGGPGGWWFMNEPELHLGADVLVPDLAAWRRDATPSFDPAVAWFDEVPHWVAEVLSPSTARRDRLVKLDLYHAAGVEHAWLVDPVERSIEIFRAAEAGWMRVDTARGEDVVILAPFAAVRIELAPVWL